MCGVVDLRDVNIITWLKIRLYYIIDGRASAADAKTYKHFSITKIGVYIYIYLNIIIM